MARPAKCRMVENEPNITYFKPRAVPMNKLEEVTIGIDELEALRLNDLEKLNQTDTAKKMNVHQSTVQRILETARGKIADALCNGKAIKIEGGHYKAFCHRKRFNGGG